MLMSLHLLWSECKDVAWGTKIMDALILHLLLCVWKAKFWRPPTMADDAITQGSIGGLGSLVYICGVRTKPWLAFSDFCKVWDTLCFSRLIKRDETTTTKIGVRVLPMEMFITNIQLQHIHLSLFCHCHSVKELGKAHSWNRDIKIEPTEQQRHFR